MKCPICNSFNTKVIFKDYPGFVEESKFEINRCVSCDSHFINSEENISELYNTIYSTSNTFGYDRYFKYALLVKEKKKRALEFLAYYESTYYPVYNLLKDESNLDILEIGCGYGYLTYSLLMKGFNVTGIDIADNAIKKAKENFGNHFICTDVKEYKKLNTKKFDLIIATEVIEHTTDPIEFLKDCVLLLKEEGKIIITTPDKDYSKQDSIWLTDLPPIHLTWIGKKGIEKLADQVGMKPTFVDFSHYYSKYENRLIKYFVTRKERIPEPSLKKNGSPILNKHNKNIIHRIIAFILHKISFIRFLSNFIFNLTIGKEITLGVIFSKSICK